MGCGERREEEQPGAGQVLGQVRLPSSGGHRRYLLLRPALYRQDPRDERRRLRDGQEWSHVACARRCGVWQLPQDQEAAGQEINAASMAEFTQCELVTSFV